MNKRKSDLPVVIHSSVKAKIHDFYQNKKHNRWHYAISVYFFLYDTVRYQDNIRAWATNTFISKGTGIGINMIPAIKKDLIKMGLIAIHQDRKIDGTLDKIYIEVKFVWKPETLEKLFYREPESTTKYKIARELLVNNFKPHEEIGADYYEFEAEVNGMDTVLTADTFFFNDDNVLVAKVKFCTVKDGYEYTVPSDRVGEIIIDLASSYKFSFSAILKTLNSKNNG